MTGQLLEVVDGTRTKVCPQCGQTLFADMDVCYGCLHSFALVDGRPAGQALSVGHVPEHLPEPEHDAWVLVPEGDERGAPAYDGCLCVEDQRGREPARGAHMRRDADLPQGASLHAEQPWTWGNAPEALGASRGLPRSDGLSQPGSSMSSTPAQADVPASDARRPSPSAVSGVVVRDASADEDATESQPALTPDAPLLTPVSDAPEMPADCPLALRLQTSSVDVAIPLRAQGLSVGRSPDNDVVLHSRAVSRRHLRVEPSGAGACVIDLGATNPALCHGEVVPAEFALPVGETIDVCGVLLTLVLAGQTPGASVA